MKALELGFSFCGISKAEFLEEEAPRLEDWLKRSYHGEMSYLERNFDKRLDPTLLVPGAKSVVSLIYNYYPAKEQRADTFKVAKYAYGEDYHFVVRDKLRALMETIYEKIGMVSGRVFVDSAPVMERAWAKRSGIGWIGKNSLLLNREMGSFFFLAELVIDLSLDYDSPVKDYCGTCTACMDACPTDAIPAPYEVNGSKCISYFTIELKDQLPGNMKGKFDDWIFGCDICQEVCPWNRFSKPHQEPRFEPDDSMLRTSKREWKEMTEEVFDIVFKKSPLQRSRYAGLMRNIDFVAGDKEAAK
ncbi:tRNA epoxyqueuosine(34) reductase QueG [Chryseolinea sp. T2]|uniref:tRNA epoxyqueuosine(34) reductase QueG n=1 Tax=Chryseolinea sp. T2 TaxID=3129255 RepID=UPI00307735B0